MLTVYSKTVCPKCMLLKSELKRKGIEFEEVNIDHDEQAYSELKDKGFMSLPVATHDGNYYVGIEQCMGMADSL